MTKRIDEYQAQEKEYTGKFIIGQINPLAWPWNYRYWNERHNAHYKKLSNLLRINSKVILTNSPLTRIKVIGKRAYKLARKGKRSWAKSAGSIHPRVWRNYKDPKAWNLFSDCLFLKVPTFEVSLGILALNWGWTLPYRLAPYDPIQVENATTIEQINPTLNAKLKGIIPWKILHAWVMV